MIIEKALDSHMDWAMLYMRDALEADCVYSRKYRADMARYQVERALSCLRIKTKAAR